MILSIKVFYNIKPINILYYLVKRNYIFLIFGQPNVVFFMLTKCYICSYILLYYVIFKLEPSNV